MKEKSFRYFIYEQKKTFTSNQNIERAPGTRFKIFRFK